VVAARAFRGFPHIHTRARSAFRHPTLHAAWRAGRRHANSTSRSRHHFADYNWDTSKGAPSFGDQIAREPHFLDDIRAYVRNCVEWLAN
jgi:hypothetical protein